VWDALLLLIAVSLLIIGGALLAIGLRGRRVDDHPLCRRCGFDLIGTPGIERCSECGLELRGSQSIRVGHRARRRAFLLGGTALLLPAVVMLGGAGLGALSGINWQHFRLTSWVISDLDSSSGRVVDAAFAELLRRQKAKSLSDDATDRIHAWVLAAQADTTGRWDESWGDFVEASRKSNQLSNEQWEQYVLHASMPVLLVRPTVRQSDPLPIEVDFELRAGSSSSFRGMWRWTQLSVRNVAATVTDEAGEFELTGTGRSRTTFLTGTDEVFTSRLELGEAPVRATIELFVEPGVTRIMDGEFSGKEVGPRIVELSGTTVVHPSDAPEALTFENDSMRDGVEQSVAISVVNRSWSRSTEQWQCTIRVRDIPVSVNWEMWIRYAGEEARGDVFDMRFSSGMTMSMTTTAFIRNPEAAALLRQAATAGDMVTVLLRPNLERLRRLTDTSPTWGGEVVIPNVPVDLEHQPSARPLYGPSGEVQADW
jgi:hypothetical protein